MKQKLISEYLQTAFGTEEKLANSVATKIARILDSDETLWISTVQTMPEPQDISTPGNDYYLVKTEHFGQRRAMYCLNANGEADWYTSYIEKLIVPVTHFMPLID